MDRFFSLDEILVPGHHIDTIWLDEAVCSCGEKVHETLPGAAHFPKGGAGLHDICPGPIMKIHCHDNQLGSGVAKIAGMDERRNVYVCFYNPPHRSYERQRCIRPDEVWWLVEVG